MAAPVLELLLALAVLAIVIAPSPPRRARVSGGGAVSPAPSCFPEDSYLDRLEGARETVRILDTFPLPHALDPRSRQRFLDGLRDVVLRGGEVRILMLHVRSQLVAQRTASVTERVISEEHYREHLQNAMNELHALREALPAAARAAFQVRLIDSFPGVTCYQCDGMVLTSFYPPNRLASDAPHRWVPEGSDFGSFIASRFRNLWEFGEVLSRHMFCEVRLTADGGSVLPDTRFVEHGDQVYLCHDDVSTMERTVGQDAIEVILPGPEGRVPRRYHARAVQTDGSDLLAEVRGAFTHKYPDGGCAGGITVLDA